MQGTKVLTVEYVKQDKIGTSFSGLLIFVFTKKQCVEFIFEVRRQRKGRKKVLLHWVRCMNQDLANFIFQNNSPPNKFSRENCH